MIIAFDRCHQDVHTATEPHSDVQERKDRLLKYGRRQGQDEHHTACSNRQVCLVLKIAVVYLEFWYVFAAGEFIVDDVLLPQVVVVCT